MARDERGSAVVASLVALATLTFGAVVWMARDVSTTMARRADASDIAFQSARAGAQGLDIAALRGSDPVVRLDPLEARRRANEAALTMFAVADLNGRIVSVDVGEDRVAVVVEVVAPTALIEGRATVLAQRN
jgi:hypothetical protein